MSSADVAPTEAHRQRRGRSLTVVVIVTAVVVAAIAVARLTDGSPAARAARTVPAAAPLPPRVLASESLLRAQAHAIVAADRSAYVAGWAEARSARRVAVASFVNLASLGVVTFEPRLTEPAVVGTARSWTATVDVSWALGQAPAAVATSQLRYRFASTPRGAEITAVRPVRGASEPVWLLPGIVVRKGPRTLVVASDAGQAHRVEALLLEAVAAVGDVLPGWRGRLMVYAAPTLPAFGRLIGGDPRQYRGIAAVTTTVDGSSHRSAATAIVLNPAVFDRLDAVGAQVVVAHEAAHAATRVAMVSMPPWVAEGFADYVGIGSVDLSTSVAGRVALRAVRRSGPPATLPDGPAFAAHGAALEAVYEESWLAASLIATRYGQRRLVTFYRDVAAHPQDVSGAFRRNLHTTEAAFTLAWRDFLQETAGGT